MPAVSVEMPRKWNLILVEQDRAFAKSLGRWLMSRGHSIRIFYSAEAALAEPLKGDCIISALRLSSMDGLQFLRALRAAGTMLPLIILTGFGSISGAVEAIRKGAADFLEKPVDREQLLVAIARAVSQFTTDQAQTTRSAHARQLLDTLTPAELKAFDQIVTGQPNKLSAEALGLSIRTVEVHRRNINKKLGAKSLAELVRIGFDAETDD